MNLIDILVILCNCYTFLGLTTTEIKLKLPLLGPGSLVENVSSVSPACHKRRLNGGGFSEFSRVGAWTGTLKNPTKCLWRWELFRRYYFFFSPPAHLYAVTYMTENSEISFNVTLKLYCDYKYTRPCMINRILGLKQLWLQVNGHAWFHLHGLHWPVWNGEGTTNSKWEYVSSGIQTHVMPLHDR